MFVYSSSEKMSSKQKRSDKKSSKKIDIQKTFEKICILSLVTLRARNQMVRDSYREVIHSILQYCLNILNGNVRLTPKQKSTLCKHKAKLGVLANKKISLRKKKQIIQKGGFLCAILAPFASVLGSLLFDSIRN